jgi:hypothetical protein
MIHIAVGVRQGAAARQSHLSWTDPGRRHRSISRCSHCCWVLGLHPVGKRDSKGYPDVKATPGGSFMCARAPNANDVGDLPSGD